MSKIITLLAAAYVGGQLKYPADGPQPAGAEEAKRLIAEGLAEDVTDEFPDGLQPDAEAPARESGVATNKKPAAPTKVAPKQE